MPANPSLFPPDFVVASEQSELEDALLRLQRQQVEAARRLAHTRRISGHQEIQNQNQLLNAASDLLPGHLVGLKNPPATEPPSGLPANQGGTPVVVPPPLPIPTGSETATEPTAKRYLGFWGAVAGGRTDTVSDTDVVHALQFSSETFKQANARLSGKRSDVANIWNANAGLFCGGTRERMRQVDRYNFQLQQMHRNSTALAEPAIAATGNIMNGYKGLIVGGQKNATSALRKGQRLLDISGKTTITSLGDFLTAPRTSPSGAIAGIKYAYIYSGYTSLTGAPLTTIEKIAYPFPTETVSILGTTISSNYHINHAAFSGYLRGYFCGGSDSNPIKANLYTRTISHFVYEVEAVGPIATSLVDKRNGAVGMASNARGYIVGGDTDTKYSVKTAESLRAGVSCRRMASQLSVGVARAGGVSNYAPSFGAI